MKYILQKLQPFNEFCFVYLLKIAFKNASVFQKSIDGWFRQLAGQLRAPPGVNEQRRRHHVPFVWTAKNNEALQKILRKLKLWLFASILLPPESDARVCHFPSCRLCVCWRNRHVTLRSCFTVRLSSRLDVVCKAK